MTLLPTPTINSNLDLRLATFETLSEGLDYAARGETGCNFFSGRGQLEAVLPYAELRERSVEVALRLTGMGLPRGSRVGLIATTSADFMIFFYACQYAGLIPVPLPISTNLGGRSAYVERLRAMLSAADVSLAVAEADMIDVLREAAEGLAIRMVGTPGDFRDLPESRGDLRPLGKEDPAYIQYSSGSTSMPRGVMITQRGVTSNVLGIARHGLALESGDRCASWLPLYHDMGLVGFSITPMMGQFSADYLPTSAFTKRPLLWLQIISDHGATISFAPTMGYDLCVRRAAKAQGGTYDLSRWRVAGVGAEMIRADVLEQFAMQFASFGFDQRAYLPSYGLAESTLAVSFAPLGRGLKTDRIDRRACEVLHQALPVAKLGNGSAKRARTVVVCGRPLPDHSVEIRDNGGRVLPDREIGSIHVKGPSLMEGYFQDEGATQSAVTEDGWLDTGDLGYLADGELVVTGRQKDLIISNGRNIWPHDLEWALEKLPDLRTGGVAAFCVEDDIKGERVVIVAECRLTDEDARQTLVRDMQGASRLVAGVDPEVMLVPTRSLTFTSSGKLSRAAVKASYLGDRLEPLSLSRPAAPLVTLEPLRSATDSG
ncbi:fatty acyl-AMP ligase [Algihabitans albus]|uniref:fatty acyl-AMP ligase n=1 Tax=Algihabitans albus TaxID=2164067 RepID=UPI000E5D16F3|nr:fatty acyl-AMP ligase [Algihabitans albus]